MKNRMLISSCVFLLLSVPVAQAIPPVYTLQSGIGSDDVIGDNESFFHITANALVSHGLSRHSITNFIAEVSTYHYEEDDNSANKLFLQGEYSYTPRAGFRVPTYSIAIRQLEEYKKDSDQDASTTSLILSLAFRVDDKSNLVGGLKFSEKSSAQDTTETAYFISLDYLLSDQWLLYTTLTVADEDIDVSSTTTTSARPVSGRLAAMGHIGPSVSGPTSSSSSSSTSSINSDNNAITVGASYAIDGQNSLDMAINNRSYETDNNKLEGTVITLDYFYRF